MNQSIPPVLLILFNRVDTTVALIDALRMIRPSKVYVSIDGPRESRPDDIEKISRVKQVVDSIDWECTITKRLLETNLGCKFAPSSAISWLFQTEDCGIILEDDCIPAPTFFEFCQELLLRYKNDECVYMISGCDFSNGDGALTTDRYYFHKYQLIWGWATWKRAWDKFDIDMLSWKNREDKFRFLSQKCESLDERLFWLEIFNRMLEKGQDSVWDYQWLYAMWRNGGKCISPCVNLITNIGFGVGATHTQQQSPKHQKPVGMVSHPIVHCENTIDLKKQREIRNNFYMTKDRGYVFTIRWVVRQLRKLISHA